MSEGSPPRPDSTPAGAAAEITIRGGTGPAYADLDALRGAALALLVAAERLDDAAAHVAAVERAVRAGEGDSPATARAAHGALAPVLHGPASLRASAQRTWDLARALQAAAALYGEAEDRAEEVVRVLLSTGGVSLGERPLMAALGVLVAAHYALVTSTFDVGRRVLRGERVPTPGELAVARPAEDLMIFLGSIGRGLAPGRQGADPNPVPGAAGLVVAGVGGASVLVPALRRQPLRVTARLGSTTQGPAPAGAADVLSAVGALYPEGGGALGTVGVQRLERPDGSRAWVVAIPGTQTGGLGWGANPMDMATNLRLMAGAADDGTELVARALAQAGVRRGEPILLAGHSQGGMVAMALAGSASFAARYDVAAVLTAGSPVAAQVVPATTPVLHLEHRQDVVPALDGRPSPALPNRTTAIRDLQVSADLGDRTAARAPGPAHKLDTYVRTARVVSAAGAESVRAWEEAAGQVLGGPGTSAVRMEFTGTRVPLTPPLTPPLTRTPAPGPLPLPGLGARDGAGPLSASGSLR